MQKTMSFGNLTLVLNLAACSGGFLDTRQIFQESREGDFNFYANLVSSLSCLRGLDDFFVHHRRGFQTEKDLERRLEELIVGLDYESSQGGKSVEMLGEMGDVELH